MFNRNDSITLSTARRGWVNDSGASHGVGWACRGRFDTREGGVHVTTIARTEGVLTLTGSKIRRHRTSRVLDGKARAIFSCVQLRKFHLMNHDHAHTCVTLCLPRLISLTHSHAITVESGSGFPALVDLVDQLSRSSRLCMKTVSGWQAVSSSFGIVVIHMAGGKDRIARVSASVTNHYTSELATARGVISLTNHAMLQSSVM